MIWIFRLVALLAGLGVLGLCLLALYIAPFVGVMSFAGWMLANGLCFAVLFWANYRIG